MEKIWALQSPGSCGCKNNDLEEDLNGEGGMAAIYQKKQEKRLRDLNGRGYLQWNLWGEMSVQCCNLNENW